MAISETVTPFVEAESFVQDADQPPPTAPAWSPFVSQRMRLFVSEPSRADLAALTEMVENGQVRPVIDRTFPLTEAADAFAYLAQGHARGKVVVTA